MAANRNTSQLMCVITRGQTDPSNLCAAGLLSHMQTDLFVSFLSASGFVTGHSSHGQRRRSKHNKERVTHTWFSRYFRLVDHNHFVFDKCLMDWGQGQQSRSSQCNLGRTALWGWIYLHLHDTFMSCTYCACVCACECVVLPVCWGPCVAQRACWRRTRWTSWCWCHLCRCCRWSRC